MQKKMISSLNDNYLLEVSFNKNQCQIVIISIGTQTNQGKCSKLITNFDLNFSNNGFTLSQFGSEKDFCQFMSHPSNYDIDFQESCLLLKWKLIGHQFKRRIQFKIKLVPQQLSEKQSLQCEVIVLRRKLADYEKAEQKRIERNKKRRKGFKEANPENQKTNEMINQKRIDQEGSYSSQTKREKKSVNQFLQKKMKINQQKLKDNAKKHNDKDDHMSEDEDGLEDGENNQKNMQNERQRRNEKQELRRQRKQQQQCKSSDKQQQTFQKQRKEQKERQKRDQNRRKKKAKKMREAEPTRQRTEKKENGQDLNEVEVKQQCKQEYISESENQEVPVRNYKSKVVIGDKTRIDFWNGDYYFGHLKDQNFHGFGVYYSKVNGTYEGEWKDGKACGYGITTDLEGNRHEGFYQNDCRHGRGKDNYPNGQSYEGEFANGCKEGYGIYCYQNGDRYEGYWKKDKCHGTGKEIYINGTSFQGEWKNDEKDGKGIMHNNLGDIVQIYRRGQLIHTDLTSNKT